MLERLTESCLIDADRTATAEFMEGIEITEPSEDEIQRNWLDMKQRLDNKLSKFSGSDSLISKLRMNISDRCCAFAKNDVGIAQLIVPTGGGKTLSAFVMLSCFSLVFHAGACMFIRMSALSGT